MGPLAFALSGKAQDFRDVISISVNAASPIESRREYGTIRAHESKYRINHVLNQKSAAGRTCGAADSCELPHEYLKVSAHTIESATSVVIITSVYLLVFGGK
jgi:hypothetical protein